MPLPRSALICHVDDQLNEVGFARWMASISDLRLVIRIHEPPRRALKRIRREIQRIGYFRMLDVFAFRVAHRLSHGHAVSSWRDQTVRALVSQYPAPSAQIVDVTNANDERAVRALRECEVDFAIARCKQLLAPRVFELPRKGVFVLHPGICPEYRNAHGGFWALASDDTGNVGTTLLRIDRGVDTGPAFAYFQTRFDPCVESPITIQDRTLFDNLPEVADALMRAISGEAQPIDTHGRRSGEWGQPWFSAWRGYLRRERDRRALG